MGMLSHKVSPVCEVSVELLKSIPMLGRWDAISGHMEGTDYLEVGAMGRDSGNYEITENLRW